VGQRIQGRLEVIFVEALQPQRLRHRVIGGPPHGREARALGCDADQDQHQGQRGSTLYPQHTREPEAISELLSDAQNRKHRATGRYEVAAEAIELALQGTTYGCNPLRWPRRQVRQRAGAHLAAFAAGFTQQPMKLVCLAKANGRRAINAVCLA
jgi:hypothetical protein